MTDLTTRYAEAFEKYQGYRPTIVRQGNGYEITTRTGTASYTSRDVRNLILGLERLTV